MKIARRPKPVGEPAADQGADEQPREQGRHEARHAAGAEQPGRGRREDPGLHEARGDVAGEQQVVELEEEAEAEQRHEAPDRPRRRQAVEAGQDGAGLQGGSVRLRDPCRRHPPAPPVPSCVAYVLATALELSRLQGFVGAQAGRACPSQAGLAVSTGEGHPGQHTMRSSKIVGGGVRRMTLHRRFEATAGSERLAAQLLPCDTGPVRGRVWPNRSRSDPKPSS